MAKRIGAKTFEFENPPHILSYASVGSVMEKEGPIGNEFDRIFDDPLLGEESWEKAEAQLQKVALGVAMEKAAIKETDINMLFAGDLLNQCIGSTFGTMDYKIPFAGVYGACSTMALSLIMAAMSLESGVADISAAVTSSHFCSAERQYRFPLEYGSIRPPSSQWTVTGAGGIILSKNPGKIKISKATLGTVEDFGVTDQNNMGAAMAPAAADTIIQFFKDTGENSDDYDGIFTGDLGQIGSELLIKLCKDRGFDISAKHNDCGLMIYDREKQDVHSGGSGCGCSASVLCSYIMHRMEEGKLNNILFIATGALLSPTSTMQGENIPSVAHLLNIRN